jgi:hypothetical protein
MNYILFNYGKTPKYLSDSIKSIIKHDENSKIYFCTDDDNFKDKRVDLINLKELKDTRTDEVIKSNFYNNFENPLWKTSMARLFALQDVSEYVDVEEYVHFDNDVLVFGNFDSIKSNFSSFKGLHITETVVEAAKAFVFGFSYVNSIENYKKICDYIFEFILTKNNKIDETNDDNEFKYIEMKMLVKAQLALPGLIKSLPSIPESDKSIVFDPADYGWFLDGVDYAEKISTIDRSHTLGEYLYEDLEHTKISFEDGKPYLYSHGLKNRIFNLHMHQKRLNKYI